MAEAKALLDRVESGNLDEVRTYIAGTTHLFRGAVGNRHMDYVCYKRS